MEKNFRFAESNIDDFMKIVEFDNKLSIHLGNNKKYESEEEIAEGYLYYSKYHNGIDEYYIFYEENNKLIGYVHIGNYIVFNHVRDESIGNILDIFVDPESRNGVIALQLLREGLNILQKQNINKAIMTVQTHNPFRFLHYGIADEVYTREKYTRKNGESSENIILQINDIKALQQRPFNEILRNIHTHRKNFRDNGIEFE